MKEPVWLIDLKLERGQGSFIDGRCSLDEVRSILGDRLQVYQKLPNELQLHCIDKYEANFIPSIVIFTVTVTVNSIPNADNTTFTLSVFLGITTTCIIDVNFVGYAWYDPKKISKCL